MVWKPGTRGRCGDCGVLEGEFHEPGCDMEICPFCRGQLITCDCCLEHLDLDASPGTYTWEHGLTREQSETWDRILEKRGRIRFVTPTVLCARCGQVWPDLFMVEDWRDVIPLPYREAVLCRRCYADVRSYVLEARREGR